MSALVAWSQIEDQYYRMRGADGPDPEEIIALFAAADVEVYGYEPPPAHAYTPGPLDGLVQQVYDAQIKAYLDAPPVLRKFVP